MSLAVFPFCLSFPRKPYFNNHPNARPLPANFLLLSRSTPAGSAPPTFIPLLSVPSSSPIFSLLNLSTQVTLTELIALFWKGSVELTVNSLVKLASENPLKQDPLSFRIFSKKH